MRKIKIYLFCKDKLIEWEINESENKTVEFILEKLSTLFTKDYVISFEYENGCYKINSNQDMVLTYRNQNVNNKLISDGDVLVCNFPYESSKVILFVQFEGEFSNIFYKFDIREIEQIKIGRSEDNDIVYENSNLSEEHLVFKFGEKDFVEAVDGAIGCYINQVKFVKSELNFGDTIFVYGLKCVYLGDYIAVNNPNENVYSELSVVDKDEIREAPPKRFLTFKKNVVDRDKVYANLDEEKIITINPPNISYNSRFLYFGIIPLITITVVLLVLGLFFRSYGSSIYLILGGLFGMATTLVFYICGIVFNKAKIDKKEKEYSAYLNDKFKKLTLIREERLRDLYQKYPKSSDCYKMVVTFDKRIWERNSFDKDFLSLTIGQGNLNFENIKINSESILNLPEEHELYQNYLNVKNNFKIIKKAPITILLKEVNKLAVVGDTEKLYDVVKNFLVQLTALHSYKDLKIGFLYSKQHEQNFDYLKEIPHVYSDKKDFRYIASSNEELVDVIYDIKNIISEREGILSENSKREFSTSYVIFIFYDSNLVIDSFLKYIKKVNKKVNVTFILLTIDNKNVPDSFKYILDIDEDNQTFYRIQESGIKKIVIPHEYRDVSNLIDISKFVYSLSKIKIFDSVSDVRKFENKSIFDLYGVSDVNDLNILDRWNKNKLISVDDVPVAIKNNNEIFSINIHAKHNGPNGIIFGDSGSGKTEFLKSMVLSYCLNFHPNKLNFVIIKSTHNLKLDSFIDLPHVVDILDKENESEKSRLILLVKNEINKRQVLFDNLKVNDINSYLNIYSNYSNMSVIPHFVIIVDDVNESDMDFIKELTSLYTLMAPLGIHVIISSNRSDLFAEKNNVDLSKFDFKVCFRVSNTRDMFNILDDIDVVNPKNSGLFNVKFSDSQIFKDIEIVFSNIEYGVENSNQNLDIVNNCGLMVKKVSRVRYFENSMTQQDVIINKTVELSNNIDLKVMSVFNSSLRYLSLLDLVGYSSNFNGFMWCESNKKCSAIVGIIDDPKYQVQRFLDVNFNKLGNLFVYGAAGTGKSTLIKTLVYSLCCEYKANYLNVYMIDVNTRNTDYFGYAPHVKDIAYNKEESKLLFKKILDEFDLRKMIFENLDISSIENYKLKTGEQLPYIILCIDSLQDIVNDVWDYSNFIKMLARDGKYYGMFVCVTSTKYGEVEMKLSEYFDNKFVFKLNNDDDYKKILGKECSINSRFKGRGLVNYVDVNGSRILEFQVALPMDCENDVELNNKLKSLFIQMNDINNKIYESSDIRDALEGDENNDNLELGTIENKFISGEQKLSLDGEKIKLSNFIEKLDNMKNISIFHNGIKNSKIVLNMVLDIFKNEKFKCYLLDNLNSGFKKNDYDKFYWCALNEEKIKEFLIWLYEVAKNRVDNKNFDLLNEEKLCVFIPEIDILFKQLDDEMFEILNNISKIEKEIGIYFVISLGKKGLISKEISHVLDLLLKKGLTIVLNHESDLNSETFVVHESNKTSIFIN